MPGRLVRVGVLIHDANSVYVLYVVKPFNRKNSSGIENNTSNQKYFFVLTKEKRHIHIIGIIMLKEKRMEMKISSMV